MLVTWGFCIHLVALASVFDIYFTSPLIRGSEGELPPPPPAPPPPARRLVLIIADGFRAESFLQSDQAPYLKSIVKDRGSWSISNTRIPTESRPGHVAIIAGFYEDPSAIAKGWKENPVEFDSVFNQSRHTWSWGSPDILPMFAKGATGSHVSTDFYSHEEEDFSGKISTSSLDTWVFDRVESFFIENQSSELLNKLNDDKIVFFLHLLGLDMAGHTHKPHSKQYRDNIKTVDEGIAKIENIIEKYYNFDGKTAFIFTADHGMTDWGSHGAGSDHETKTPFIAWGAGITHSSSDLLSSKESFNEIYQADICPLMATLIGIGIPVDSVGILPDIHLNMTLENKAMSLYTNMRQMLAQYNRKRITIEENTIPQIYKPYDNLTEAIILNKLKHIEELMTLQNFNDVINECKQVINLCLIGLEYYQNYYQKILLNCITMSFFGWIFWLLTVLLQGMESVERVEKTTYSVKKKTKFNVIFHVIFALCLTLAVYIVYVQRLPLQYYIYFSLPVLLWWKGCLSLNVWYDFFKNISNTFQSSFIISVLKLCLMTMLYLIGIIILVSSFFYRWTLSIGLLGLAIFPLHNSYRKNIPIKIIIVWILSCIALAGFSFLPVIGKQDDKHLVGASGVLWFILSIAFLFLHALPMLKFGQETKKEHVVLVIPLIMMLIGIQNKYFVAYQFSNNKGLPLISQIISWLLTALSFSLPLFSSRWMTSRLFSINTNLAIFFILLSVSHEGFFLLALANNLFCWLGIEHYSSGYNRGKTMSLLSFDNGIKPNRNKLMKVDRALNADDFRRSYIFLLYIILSFFGTGNIASVNSFDPQWVRCFITQFAPFTMTALILSKTLVPFLSVACSFCAVNKIVKAPTGHLFLIVLIFSDLMGLYFLHMVTNKGSWLDIGTSISHYVIVETIVLFVSLLYGFGKFLTETSGWKIFNTKERYKQT